MNSPVVVSDTVVVFTDDDTFTIDEAQTHHIKSITLDYDEAAALFDALGDWLNE